jgi:putative spermidine/putrescine transport system substrate-binding protein
MTSASSTTKRAPATRRGVVGLLSIALTVLVAHPAWSDGHIRPMSQWTEDNPATLAEVEDALEKHRGESFVFTSWGGGFQEGQRKAYLAPFQEKFGIKVIEDSPPTPYSKIGAMAETGNITWHVVDIGVGGGGLAEAGQLEAHDRRIVDTRRWVPGTESPFHGGGGNIGSDVLLINTNTWPTGGPRTAADFFDVEKFPGRRGIYPANFGWKTALRWALLSRHLDWLETDEGKAKLVTLEPDEIDEAYEVLEAFHPHISVFQNAVNDCFTLIISDELDMCMSDNLAPVEPIQDGAPIRICWSCGHWGFADVWVTPKGLAELDPQKFELIQLFMAWTGFPERNAEISKYLAVGPINLDAGPLLVGPEWDTFRDALPTAPAGAPYLVTKDAVSDGKIQPDNLERFIEWSTTGKGG